MIQLIYFIVFPFLYPYQEIEAREIVRKADEKMRGNTMQAEISIKTIRPSWSREMHCKVWEKGNDLAMILIQSPVRDKGISFLKRKKEVWNWLPTLERTIKLPPSMMSQSWMGTDFTNDDLVKESSIVEDYDHQVIGDTLIQERKCFIIQMIPKAEAAVIWSKVILCIDKKDFLELHTRFYDEDGVLINTMNSFDIKKMHDRIIPTRFEMLPANKKGHRTEMIYENIQYNSPLEDSFFSVVQMKNLK
jgi:outer membrane lipoprotein-sorting protein